MDTLPLELMLSILGYLRGEFAGDPDQYARIASLSVRNRLWREAVESIVWRQLIITVHAHRRSPDVEAFRLFTTGTLPYSRRSALKSLTVR